MKLRRESGPDREARLSFEAPETGTARDEIYVGHFVAIVRLMRFSAAITAVRLRILHERLAGP